MADASFPHYNRTTITLNKVSILDEFIALQNSLLKIFNTRELATLIWIVIALSWGIASTKMRQSVLSLVKALLTRKFVVIYIIAFLYIGFIVIILERIGLWEKSLLKDTIYWAILSALTLMYDIAQSKQPLSVLKKNLVTAVQFSVIIQFIFNLKTFNFWVEFFAIPIIVLLIGMYVFSQQRKEHAPVRKLLGSLGIVASIIAFGYVVYFAITNYHNYLNFETAKQFVLPIILTVSFTPLLAVLNIVVQYENVVHSLKRRARTESQYRYMLIRALFYFNFNIKGLIRWQQMLTFSDTENKQTIRASMRRIRQQQKLEEIPPEYLDLKGWRPEYAQKFLRDCECEISNYDSELGDVWIGKSDKLKLDADFMTGDYTFTIRGNKFIVNHLQLHFRMFDPSRSKDVEKFIAIADTLYRNAVYETLPYKIRISILRLKNLDYQNDFADISLRISRWKNKMKGYDLNLSLNYKTFL